MTINLVEAINTIRYFTIVERDDAEILRDEACRHLEAISKMLIEISETEDEEVRQIMDKYGLVL